MNSLQQLSSISKLLASRNHQNSDVYAHYIHSFRNVSTVLIAVAVIRTVGAVIDRAYSEGKNRVSPYRAGCQNMM